MRKYDCIWLMLCLVWTGTSSCSDKKNSADKQEQGVSTVLPDAKKGQNLAELDKFRLEQKLSQAEDALLKAELELKDVLIGQGYTSEDFSKVPVETMKLAKVKSGYEQSRSQYELVKRETEHATLVAPFDGIVANLFSKPYNLANTSEVFCTVILQCWRMSWLLLKQVIR